MKNSFRWVVGFLLLALVLTVTGCPPVEQGPTVYVAGFYSDGSKNVPCYWAGGARTDLPGDGTHDAVALAIFVKDGIVYTGGYYSNGTAKIPCYWVGTARTDLAGDGVHDAFVRSLCMENDIVYSAGNWDDGVGAIPCYWTKTTRTDLGDSTTGGIAHAVAVENGVVYAGGYYGDGRGCYWTGTTRTDLIDGANGTMVYGIAVSDGTVYAGGYDSPPGYTDYNAVSWIGTTRFDLFGGDSGYNVVNDIDLADGVVYSAGAYNAGSASIPCYWQGANARSEIGGTKSTRGEAVAVRVLDHTACVAGYDQSGYCYWILSQRYSLVAGRIYDMDAE